MIPAAVVRLAAADDLPFVQALARETAEAPRWGESAYGAYLAAPSEEPRRKALFIAVDEDGVRGFLAATTVAGEVEIESVAVTRKARRSGVGSRLLDAVEAWARQQRADVLLLEVRSANATAQAFYLARGFAQAGVRPRYYNGPVDDAVLMRRELLPEQAADGPG